jgi:hypothetical protein
MTKTPARIFNGRNHREMVELDDLERHDENWSAETMTFGELKALLSNLSQSQSIQPDRKEPSRAMVAKVPGGLASSTAAADHHGAHASTAYSLDAACACRISGRALSIVATSEMLTLTPPSYRALT